MKCILVFVAIAVSCLASVPLAAQTELPRVARLGMLSDLESFGNPISPSGWLASFRAGLRDSGYEEGKNIRFEFRNGDRDPEKLAKMAAELTAMKVDVIVASSTTAAKAAKAATHAIPIVFWGAEPISSGLVANLDHPGENLTGVTANEEQQAEFLAMLKEVVPELKRVAILFNRSYAPVPGLLKNAESGARVLGLSTQLVEVAAPSDLPGAFEAMKREGSRAVLVLNHGMFFRERAKLATLAIENGIAVSTPYLANAEAGALIAHEPDFDRVWRLNASYVDKILKGANPGDLPVERLATFRYSINLKTAKALGLTIPQSVLNRAALVIPNSGDEANQSSAPSKAEQEVLQAENERVQAVLHNDVAAMDRLLGAEFIVTDVQGGAHDKADEVALYRDARRRTKSWEPSDVKVHVYADTAIVTERATVKDVLEGEQRDIQIRLTHVWVKRDGRWQVVARQATRIAAPPPTAIVAERKASDEAAEQARLDAVRVDHKHYKIDFENDRVRVVRVQYGPHEKSVIEHEHPGNSVGVYVTDFHAKVTFADGSTRDVDGKAGKTIWRAPSVRHTSTENLRDQPMEALWVELKPRSGAANAGYDSKAEQEVRQVERELTEALSQGDFATVERIYAEDYALTTADGELQNKSQRIAALKSTDPKTVTRNRDDITVRVYGGTAVVTGHTLFRSQAQGSPKDEDRRFTHLFARRQGHWQMVTSQVTRISVQSQDTEANKALVRRYIEATNSRGLGDEAVIDEFIAPDFIRHGGKELRGSTSFKQIGAMVQAAFPDWKWSIEDLIAEGSKVVVRMTGRGTQRGEFQDIPPTGKQVTLDVVMIYRIAVGKIVEQWRTADDLGRLRQLGATIAPPGQPK